MLYKKKKSKLALRKIETNEKYIGVIETTMMYCSKEDKKEYLISAFTLFVEEATKHLILIRFYEDFIEFDKRIKAYYRKFKVPLPKLILEHQSNEHSLKNKLLLSLSSKKMIYGHSNADNLEKYLRHCASDLQIQSCSLFKEFLQPQREDDNCIQKATIQTILQESMIIDRQSLIDTLHDTTSLSRSPSSPNTLPPLPSSLPNLTTNLIIQSNSSIISHQKSLYPLIMSNATGLTEQDISSEISSSSASSSSEENRVTIKDFQFIKVIGRGCMGKVLLVQHKKTSKLLALKAISKKTVIEQSQIDHIKAEQQILADISSIHHPFLIKLRYSFQDMNQLFLVLDYHVGGDLATQLRLYQTLPPDRCRFYVAEIILGIQELHRLGILYRDLKPENILLASDGHLVLTDFGLSKQFYDGLSLDDQRTSTFCGTAEYLAPEILNDQPYSYTVDYWSLGTVLYEMLLGITPFWAEDRDVMYERIRQDPLVFPYDLDPVTADFIDQLLIRDPELRLGHGLEGQLEVRAHPYFEDLDWHRIYNKQVVPPYIPKLYSETDFSFFESEFLNMTPRLSPVDDDSQLSQNFDAFEGYSYINHESALEEPESEVIPYDDIDSMLSSDIHSIDLIRDQRCPSTEDFDRYYPPRPARPVTRTFSIVGQNECIDNFSHSSISSTH